MEKLQTMGVFARNSVALSVSLNTASVPVTTRIETMSRRTEAAPNIGPSTQTTDSPSTAAASISRKPTLCVPSANDTIPLLWHLASNGYGYAMEQVRQTLILWLTFLLWPLLSSLFSLPAFSPFLFAPLAPRFSYFYLLSKRYLILKILSHSIYWKYSLFGQKFHSLLGPV